MVKNVGPEGEAIKESMKKPDVPRMMTPEEALAHIPWFESESRIQNPPSDGIWWLRKMQAERHTNIQDSCLRK